MRIAAFAVVYFLAVFMLALAGAAAALAIALLAAPGADLRMVPRSPMLPST